MYLQFEEIYSLFLCKRDTLILRSVEGNMKQSAMYMATTGQECGHSKKKKNRIAWLCRTCCSANANKLENPPLTANKLHPVRQSLQAQCCGIELRRASRYIRVRRVVCNSTLRYLYSGVCMTRMTDCAGAQHSACSTAYGCDRLR